MSLLWAAFEDTVRRSGATAAFREGARAVSYDALAADVERLASAIRAAGLRAGDVVAVASSSAEDGMRAVLATWRAGGVPFLLAPGAPPPAVAAWTLAGGPVGGQDGRQVGGPDGGAVGGSGGQSGGRGGQDSGPIGGRDGRQVGGATLRPTGGGGTLAPGTAFLRATGGTTGASRLVAFSEAHGLAMARAGAALMDLEPGQIVASTVPVWSGYGWTTTGLAPLLRGATTVSVSSMSPRQVLGALRERGCVWGATTSPVVRALARLPSDGGGPVRARLLVAAAPYPGPESEVVWRRYGLAVIDRYGVTEAGPVAQAREPGGPLHPAPGVRVRLVGEPPVLEIAGDAVGLGYVEGAPAAPFGGVFRTADRAEVSADGAFRLLGRTDRIIRRAGRAVDLTRVERILVALPSVASARARAVAGALDVDIVVEAVPEDGARLDAEALLEALGKRLDAWERPARIDVLPGQPPGGAEKWCHKETLHS